MRTFTTFVITAIFVLTGPACKKDTGKADEKIEVKAGEGKTEVKIAAVPSSPAGKAAPSEMTAVDFFKDYKGLKGLAAMTKYDKGVTVSGKIKRTFEEANESKTLSMWLDAGDTNWISLKFKDEGAAAKAKGVKKDDTIKAACRLGGAADKYIMLLDCELK